MVFSGYMLPFQALIAAADLAAGKTPAWMHIIIQLMD